MSQGLGKNSPVVLQLGKANYEALIQRHGQWIRWRVARKCTCLQKNSQQPDIHCDKCKGLGYIYDIQKAAICTETIMTDDEYSARVSDEFENAGLVSITDAKGEKVEAEKSGKYLLLNKPYGKAKPLYVVLSQDNTKRIEGPLECKNIGFNYFQIPDLRVSKPGTDDLYHTAPCDILSIDKITDSDGKEYKAVELRNDQFFIETKTEEIEIENPETGEMETVIQPIPVKEPVTVRDVKYIEPFIFALLSQELSKQDQLALEQAGGEAMLTFPYNCDVSNGDILTVLSGTYTQKDVLTRKKSKFDELPAYFIEDVVFCEGEREFVKGVDFVLVGTNSLKWICEDAPEEGENYSVIYKIFPTYIVVKAIPQIRTSENQRLPKKAAVKLFSAYGEKRGVNRQ